MTSTTAWKVAVDRGSHCCMTIVRRFRVSFDLISLGATLMLRALTILVTASGLLSSARPSIENSLVPKDGIINPPDILQDKLDEERF